MFTGIITAIGTVRQAEPVGPERDMQLTIGADPAFLAAHGGTELGASIACSGVCLTATSLGADWFTADVSAASISRTAIGTWTAGKKLNLERSLRMGDELGGHLVSGHVDGVGRVISATPENASLRLTISVPVPLHRYIAEKGSVSVDGVSLTVNAVAGVHFTVNIIPHTADHTTLGLLRAGDAVHIEIDMLARYVARLSETA
jgi:riboflavin synthase